MSFDSNVLSDTLRFSIKLINFLGYNFSNNRLQLSVNRSKGFLTKNWRNIYLFLVILNITVHMTYNGLYIAMKSTKSQGVLDGLIAFMVSFHYLERIFNIWRNKECIQKILLEIIHTSIIPCIYGEYDSKRIRIIISLIKTCKWTYISFAIINVALVILETIMGIIRAMISNEQVYTIFVNIQVSNYIQMAAVISWVYWTFFNFAVFYISFNLMIFVMLSFIAVQFMRLKCEIRNVFMDIENINLLKKLVDKHAELIRFTAQLNDVFRGSFLLIYLVYPLFFAGFEGIFNLSEDLSARFIVLTVITPTVIFEFIFCYLSQAVYDASDEIRMELYNADLIVNIKLKHKKDLLLIMTQKACYINSSPLRPVNLRAFTKVLQFALVNGLVLKNYVN